MLRRRVMGGSGGCGSITIPSDFQAISSTAKAGDAVLYDKVNNRKIVVTFENLNITDYPASQYSPIGVIAVPSGHNVYSSLSPLLHNAAGMVSLKYMNYTTPDTGSTSSQGIYYGQYGKDIYCLSNLNSVVHVGSNGTVNETAQGSASNAYLPSEYFKTVKNPFDQSTFYYFNDGDKYIPSPYNSDGSRNLVYIQTETPSSATNAMTDFNGKGNTEILTDLATSQGDWRTAESITHNIGIGYSPAACCCWRYSTDGTSQGEWYLPACGEFGYVIVRLKTINNTISKIVSLYGSSTASVLSTSGYFWSSSEGSSYYARYLGTYYGYVGSNYKNYRSYVRAFCLV